MKNDDEKQKFARESFTFRRMRKWQIWALLSVVVILLIAYVIAQ